MDAAGSAAYGTFARPPACPVLSVGHAGAEPRPAGRSLRGRQLGTLLVLVPTALIIACGFLIRNSSHAPQLSTPFGAAAAIVTSRLDGSAAPKQPIPYKYGVMMDLGSSGSRLFVYRWQLAFPLRSIIQLGQQETEPGVSWYYATAAKAKRTHEVPVRVASSLLPLVEFAKTIVPPNDIPLTAIHAKCTAGCRLLDAAAVRLVLEGVRSALGQSGFRFQPEYATEMSGEMEAILDWVSINAALGLLHQPKYFEAGQDRPLRPTVGVLDVGGVSAQIAYSVPPPPAATERRRGHTAAAEPPPVVQDLGHGRFHLRLVTGVEHTIYAISRMHYGMHNAELLVMSHEVDPEVEQGLSRARRSHFPPAKDAHGRPLRNVHFHPCVQKGVYLVTAVGHIVTGTGDARACLNSTQHFFRRAEKTDLGGVKWAMPAPLLTGPTPFAAMDNLYKLANLAVHVLRKDTSAAAPANNATPLARLPFTWDSLAQCMANFPSTDPETLMGAAEVTCAMDFAELQLRFGGLLETERLRDSCYGLVHMTVLLSQVYTTAKGQAVHPMGSVWRCPGLMLPDIDKQFPGTSYTLADLQSNLHAVYTSSWALGGMVLAMEAEQIGPPPRPTSSS